MYGKCLRCDKPSTIRVYRRDDKITIWSVIDNTKIIWNENYHRWETEDGKEYINGKKICQKCGKPQLDINGVEDCDFCLQGLTVCDFIDYACCGHGKDENAYISLKDGRRFILDR